MAESFVRDLMTMRVAASEAKTKLLAPLLDWLECMEKAHVEHFLGGERDAVPDEKRQKAVRAAWRNNPWGCFQKGLFELRDRYLIFGFNAEVRDPAEKVL